MQKLSKINEGVPPSVDGAIDAFVGEVRMSEAPFDMQATAEQHAAEILTALGVQPQRFLIDHQMSRTDLK